MKTCATKNTNIPLAQRKNKEWPYFLGIVLIVSALADGVVTVVKKYVELPINQVVFTGELKHLDIKQMHKIIEIEMENGFLGVKLDEVSYLLNLEPWVKQVSVKKVWPDTLEINVTEHKPMATLNYQGIISQQGNYFEPKVLNITKDLPIFYGEVTMINKMTEMYHALSRTLGKFNKTIKTLHLNKQDEWIVEFNRNIKIILGRKHVLQHFSRFLIAFNSNYNQFKNKIDTIDLRYSNGFSVRWKTNNNKLSHWIEGNA